MVADRAQKTTVLTSEPRDIGEFFRALRRRFQANCGEAYAKLLNLRPQAGYSVHTLFVRVDEPTSATEAGGMTTLADNSLLFYHFQPEPTKSIITPDYNVVQKRRWEEDPRLPPMTREEVRDMA